MSDILYYLSWAGAFFTGWIIPWWFWPAAGAAGGIAAFLLLPGGTPMSIRQFAAMTLVTVGVSMGLYSMGIDNGISLENERWERLMAAEKKRLEEGFKEQLGAERLRAQLAANALDQMRETVEELTNAADKVDRPDDIVVPEHIARGVFNLRPAYTKGNRR